MPSYGFGVFLEKTISVHFPGGRIGFAAAGGDAVVVPVPTNRDIAYVLTPKETTGSLDLAAFRTAVERNCARRKVELRWADAANFEGCDPAETKERILAAIRTVADAKVMRVMVLSRPVALMVMIDSDDAQTVVDVFKGVAGLRRLVVVHPQGIIVREQEPPKETQPEAQSKEAQPETQPTPVKIEAAREGRAINADDVADVASLLEHSKDITEFLGKI